MTNGEVTQENFQHLNATDAQLAEVMLWVTFYSIYIKCPFPYFL